MGGVLSDAPPQTLPAMPGILNRLSCSTMNQLYSPQKSALFFNLMQRIGVPLDVVCNNSVTAYEYNAGNVKRFLDANEIQSDSLQAFGNAFYGSPYKPPVKPFDVYAAIVMGKLINGDTFGRQSCKSLFFDKIHGISLIGDVNMRWENVRSNYVSNCDRTKVDDPNPFVQNKSISFIQEKNVLESMDFLSGEQKSHNGISRVEIVLAEPVMDPTTLRIGLE